MPSRRTTATRVEKVYEDCVELKVIWQRVDKTAVTIGLWIGLTTESYVTITHNFIQNWDFKTAFLQTQVLMSNLLFTT